MNQAGTTARAQRARVLVIDLLIMTAIGISLALIGPFGTFDQPLATRLIVWLGFAYLGYVLYSPIDALALRLAPVLDLPAWILRVAACVLASAPMAIAVWVLPQLPGPIRTPSPDLALQHYSYVLVVGSVVTIVTTLTKTGRVDPAQATPIDRAAPLSQAPTPFHDRLPVTLGSDLLALEMEDHYVRAHTALGSELILLRMRDAVSELAGIDGAQVHRSWWVARDAVTDVRREGRNIKLVLENGLEAPVSRARVQPLKAAGWF